MFLRIHLTLLSSRLIAFQPALRWQTVGTKQGAGPKGYKAAEDIVRPWRRDGAQVQSLIQVSTIGRAQPSQTRTNARTIRKVLTVSSHSIIWGTSCRSRSRDLRSTCSSSTVVSDMVVKRCWRAARGRKMSLPRPTSGKQSCYGVLGSAREY